MTKIQDGIKYEQKARANGQPFWCVAEYVGGGKRETVKIPDKVDDIPVAEIAALAFDTANVQCVEINCERISFNYNSFYKCKYLCLITFFDLEAIKAPFRAVVEPDPDFVAAALTSIQNQIRVDVLATRTVNKIFRENLSIVHTTPLPPQA